MYLKIIDTLEQWVEPFKSFVEKNHDNPLMWVAFFLAGIAAWSIVFGILHKNGD